MDKELTPKQQTSEAIRQAETILLITGQHPNIDQTASTIALAAILRKFGKKVTAVISDDIPPASKFLPTQLLDRDLGGMRDFIVQVDLSHAELDGVRYEAAEGKLNINITPFSGGFNQRDVSFSYGDMHFDLVIVLGVASYSRIDKAYLQNAEMMRHIPLINIDFHRINEQYGAVNLLETSAASLSEILIALSESLQSGLIDADIATTMLTALYAATDRFTAIHTTAKTMTVAAQMVAGGADQQKVVKALFGKGERGDRGERDRGEKRSAAQPPTSASANRQAPKPALPVPVAPQMRQSAPTQAPANSDEKPAERAQPISNSGASFSIRAENYQSEPNRSQSPEPNQPNTSLPKEPAQSKALPEPEPVTKLEQPAEPEPGDDPPAPNRENQPSPSLQIQPTMEDLLPPQHIELSPPNDDSGMGVPYPVRSNPLQDRSAPEPLINDPGPPPKPQALSSNKAVNPTNNPIFAQRLDDFEY